MKLHRHPQPHLSRQRGAILVTSLLLLLTLTVIGISVMQITRMQERMAGNTRDLNLAFQGAEAGLRDGEQQIEAAMLVNPCTLAPCAVFQRAALPVLNNRTAAWWAVNSQEYGVDGAADLGELDQDPQFVVEELRKVRYSLNVDDLAGRDFFQITSRSTGATGRTNTVVQVTYAKVLD